MKDNKKSISLRYSDNELIYFVDHTKIWQLKSGIVDLYAIELDNDLQVQSSRRFLYRVEIGDFIIGFNPDLFTYGIALAGTSQNAEFEEISLGSSQFLRHSFLSSSIEKWINNICEYCLEYDPSPNFIHLQEGTDQTIKRGSVVFSNKDFLWVNLKKGSFTVFGQSLKSEDPKLSEFNLFPVSKFLGLTALQKENLIDVYTGRAISIEKIIEYGFRPFRIHLFEKMQSIAENRSRSIEMQIKQKIAIEQDLFSSSLLGLNRILTKRKEITGVSKGKKDVELLVSTCAVIANAYGREIIAPKNIDGNGSLNTIDLICESSKLRTRKVILRGKWWNEENGHLLVFDKESKKPKALIQKSVNRYHLIDKENGTTSRVDEGLAYTLDPEAFMFLPNFEEKIAGIIGLFRFAIKDLRKNIYLLLMAAFVGSLLGLLTPILSNVIFDDVVPTADGSFLKKLIAIMLMVAVIQALLNLSQGVMLIRLETKMNMRLQAGLMNHLIGLPTRFFSKFTAGDLTLRALTANSIRQIVSNTLLTAVLSGTFSIVNLLLLYYYDSRLAWVAMGLALFGVFFIMGIGYLKLKYDREIAKIQGQIQGLLFEFLSGIEKIRIGGAEKRIFSLWANKFAQLKMLNFKSGTYQNFVEVFKGSYPLISNIFFFFFIYYYFEIIAKDESSTLISVGSFIAFIIAFGQFLNQCLDMSFSFISSLNIIPLYERVRPILEAIPETQENSVDIGLLRGDIEFNHVFFRYEKEMPLVLDNVSIEIKAGDMVAFVGPSGSGKSTMLRILLGFEKPVSGSLYYDGQEYLTLNKNLLRKQIGVVLQDGALMPGSILKNIIGNANLTTEDAWEAIRMAGIEEDIKMMPMGIHTVISEGASTISGGQKQRLLIARALVHKPSIIFMDEATSALDNRTQSIVKESLDQLQATRIIVAHRLSTIRNADKIFVLNKGKIEESGSFEELMNNNGLFSKMAKRQII